MPDEDPQDDPLAFKPLMVAGMEGVDDPEGLPHAKVLTKYKVEHQEMSQWCWAALTKTVTDFYSDGEHEWTQCKLVNAERGRTDACDEPRPHAANAPWYVWKALQRVGHYGEKKQGGKPDFELARKEIDDDRPLCILIGWKGGGGHFVGLYGYDEAGQLLHIGDPWTGPAIVAYDTFPDTYEHGGSWNWSYWTAAVPPEPPEPTPDETAAPKGE